MENKDAAESLNSGTAILPRTLEKPSGNCSTPHWLSSRKVFSSPHTAQKKHALTPPTHTHIRSHMGWTVCHLLLQVPNQWSVFPPWQLQQENHESAEQETETERKGKKGTRKKERPAGHRVGFPGPLRASPPPPREKRQKQSIAICAPQIFSIAHNRSQSFSHVLTVVYKFSEFYKSALDKSAQVDPSRKSSQREVQYSSSLTVICKEGFFNLIIWYFFLLIFFVLVVEWRHRWTSPATGHLSSAGSWGAESLLVSIHQKGEAHGFRWAQRRHRQRTMLL